MKITMRRASELRFSEFNPRYLSDHDRESLRESLRTFGFVEPLVVNKNPQINDVVVGGNQRLSVALELGIEEVPTIEVDLPETKERILNLALNRIHGDWDEVKLHDVIESIQAENGDIELTGFTDIEIEKMLAEAAVFPEKEFDENIPVNNKCPKCGYEW